MVRPRVIGRGWRNGVLLPLFVLLACSSPFKPGEIDVSFEALGHLNPPLDGTAEVNNAGALVIEGSITSPCVPYDAHVSAGTDGVSVTVTVVGEATGPCPMDAIDELSYRTTLTGLASGEYMLFVHHTYADAEWPDKEYLKEPIAVP